MSKAGAILNWLTTVRKFTLKSSKCLVKNTFMVKTTLSVLSFKRMAGRRRVNGALPNGILDGLCGSEQITTTLRRSRPF